MNLPVPDPAFRWSVEPWGAALRCRALEPVAQHLFTTRQLELTPDGWLQAAQSMDVAMDRIQRIRQVHGSAVQVWRRGTPRADPLERPEADAQISNDPAHVLAVQVADCVPMLAADPRLGTVAAVHAGWRGTAAGVGPATIDALQREFGTRSDDLLVAIGPSIGACCYQVGDELIEAFRRSGATDDDLARWFARDATGRLRLDLWAANRDQLVRAGVSAARIFVAGLCTQTHATIFDSFRADGARAGRMAALIRLPAPDADSNPAR